MTSPLIIEETNLSVAWSLAFLRVMGPGVKGLAPLVVNLTGFRDDDPKELPEVRDALDATLRRLKWSLPDRKGRNLYDSRSNANLICPYRWYERAQRSVMSTPGKLIVFEGPDAVGKSTLAREVAGLLTGRGTPCDLMAFPGREPGTLGHHVYQLHHDPARFGVAAIPPASLQLLHVAAHLDAIAGRILPALASGRWVVLDRFWWSTWAYGLAGEAARTTLEAMIAVERAEWGDVLPAVAFLVRRPSPLRDGEPPDRWSRLVPAYHELALAEEARHPVVLLDNEGTVAEAAGRAVEAIDAARFRVSAPRRQGRAARTPSRRRASVSDDAPDLFSRAGATRASEPPPPRPQGDQRAGPHLFCPMAPARPSEVYATYWRLAAERQAVFFRRIEGVWPLTADPILAKHKFCNAYRASDRVSQYLIRNVIYRHDQSAEEVVFRTLLFKLFNKVETWEPLERELGTPSCREFDPERYAAILDRALEGGRRVFAATACRSHRPDQLTLQTFMLFSAQTGNHQEPIAPQRDTPNQGRGRRFRGPFSWPRAARNLSMSTGETSATRRRVSAQAAQTGPAGPGEPT